MEIALVQYDIAWEDKPANHARIEAMLQEERKLRKEVRASGALDGRSPSSPLTLACVCAPCPQLEAELAAVGR